VPSVPDSTERRLPLPLGVVGAVLVGVLTALQARVNGSLSAAIADGFVAAVISFGSGLVILVVLSLLLPAGRAGVRRLIAERRAGSIPLWMLLGGFAGAVTVITQTLTVATVGVALFTVGVVAGQTVNGLVLDRVGFGPAGVVAVTVPRLLGGALAIAAVIVCVSGGIDASQVWMLVLPLLAGAGISWQQATNGRLRQRVGSPLTATLVNFAGGTAVLLAAAAAHTLIAGFPADLGVDPWLYLGGALGVVYIFLSAAIVRSTGVLLLGLGSVAGLLTTSVVLDAFWPAPASPPFVLALVAVVVALAGVLVIVIPLRRR
jgi:bacterial/archaeal transporter family-2 protein